MRGFLQPFQAIQLKLWLKKKTFRIFVLRLEHKPPSPIFHKYNGNHCLLMDEWNLLDQKTKSRPLSLQSPQALLLSILRHQGELHKLVSYLGKVCEMQTTYWIWTACHKKLDWSFKQFKVIFFYKPIPYQHQKFHSTKGRVHQSLVNKMLPKLALCGFCTFHKLFYFSQIYECTVLFFTSFSHPSCCSWMLLHTIFTDTSYPEESWFSFILDPSKSPRSFWYTSAS